MTTVHVESSRASELPRLFVAALRARELYPANHPLVHRQVTALGETLDHLLTADRPLVIGVVAGEMIVANEPVAAGPDLLTRLLPQLQTAGIERISFRAGVTRGELDTLINWIRSRATQDTPETTNASQLPHITVDQLRAPDASSDARPAAVARQAYGTAINAAELAWQSASHEGVPDIGTASSAVSELADVVSSHRPALLALTTVQQFHDDTFSHMVNVAVLTLAQARTLGIDRPLLHEIGLAAMMHDIGKVRTPPEILTKPGSLTPRELEIMQRHVVDGAEMLRQMADVPSLAPIVAFEHHLRPNGTGYPSVARHTLNLATRLCSIADVYDAMRMQRDYQNAFPTDRILAVLKRNSGGEFDPHLVRRFVQLVGIYPPGTLVRLSSQEIAVILQTHAPDPSAPLVRIVRGSDGNELSAPTVRPLWKQHPDDTAVTVDAPVKPTDCGIDPLRYL